MEKRDSRIDIARLVAYACLIIVHYILRIGFYDRHVDGIKWLLLCSIRYIGTCCIPLFLIITGYLVGDKPYKKGYYKKITHTLAIYVLVSVIFQLYYLHLEHESITMYSFFKKLLSYEGTPYSWYVELYIGLFLLSPFLSRMYQALNEKEKRGLIITLLALTALPSLTNVYVFNLSIWWSHPRNDLDYFKFVPEWWVFLYPLTYYFIGCRMKEKQPRVNKFFAGCVIIVLAFLFGLYSFWRSRWARYVAGEWQDWGSWMNLLLSVLIFLFILSMKEISNLKVKRCLKVLSDAVFGAYLLSWIPETYFYNMIINNTPDIMRRFEYYPITILVYITALGMSICLNLGYDVTLKICRVLREHASEKKEKT